MRDIVFRGKRIDNGEWVEGYYMYYQASSIPGQQFHQITTGKGEVYGGVERFNIDPETVCQFVGLTDKNGKMIFEGDLLSVIRGNVIAGKMHPIRTEIGVVEYREDKFLVKVGYGYMDICPLKYIEVIGNIYDNPELFKEEQYDHSCRL